MSIPSGDHRAEHPASAAQSSAARRLDEAQRRSLRFNLIWIGVVLSVFLVARLLHPEADQRLVIPGLGTALPDLCSFRRITGTDCPGCGFTRCFVLAARLRLAEAWAMHPVAALLVLYLAASIPHRLWRVRRLLRGRPIASTTAWEIGLVMVLVGAAYVRWAVVRLF